MVVEPNAPASPSPLRPECESLRDCETEGCGSPSQVDIVELKGWIINLSEVVSFDNHYLAFDLIPLMSERGLSRENIDGYRMHMLFTSGFQLVICNQKIFCRSVLTVLQC